jgi:hypothetical protein
MYYELTLVQVVHKVVVHKQLFRQSHCFTYIVTLTVPNVTLTVPNVTLTVPNVTLNVPYVSLTVLKS